MIEKKQSVKFDDTTVETFTEASRGEEMKSHDREEAYEASRGSPWTEWQRCGTLKTDAAEPWKLPEIVIVRPSASTAKKTKTAEMPATDLADYLARKGVPFRYTGEFVTSNDGAVLF